MIDFFCVILPIFFVSDTYFIKVFSAKHLVNPLANSETSESLLTNTEISEDFMFRNSEKVKSVD